MMAADQLFSKGRILPLREARPVTLRDELRAPDAAAADRGRRAPRWKELLGLKRSHKHNKTGGAAAASAAADAHHHVDLVGDHGGTGE
ncbi:hypothetical protein EJB05_48726 [Eragrostis curvula]|uniref:Uncharacterized protein n=1 Tax=Eragrostis curvula TaxID=38414 RepID=A0A5J9T2L5_9POAL|nr:hypothetical protein EJB05_48726 [Eragrostis curvula]